MLDRFKQISPKIMFSVDAVRYNNKIHDHLQKLTQVVQSRLLEYKALQFVLNKSVKFILDNNINQSLIQALVLSQREPLFQI